MWHPTARQRVNSSQGGVEDEQRWPTYGWRELAMKLGLGQGRIREEQLMELLEERLRTTGSLLRPV